jgi:hypothetical protein
MMKKIFTNKLIIISAVVGICLIVKVYIIRKILNLVVDVQDIAIPGIFLVLYEYVHQMLKRKEIPEAKKLMLTHPLYWSIIIVILTAISLYWYLP